MYAGLLDVSGVFWYLLTGFSGQGPGAAVGSLNNNNRLPPAGWGGSKIW